MGYLTDLDPAFNATIFATNGWINRDQIESKKLKTGVSFKKTRSTLALNACDLSDLAGNQVAETFEHLLRLCKFYERPEIVIECLDCYSGSGEKLSLRKSINSLQSDLTRASRKINLYPPRIALEKRGQHFDLRVYPSFH